MIDDYRRPKPAKDTITGRFLLGNSGGGRSKGSRNKLTERFITDLLADWEKHGRQALAACRRKQPAAYLRTIAELLPKETEMRDDTFDGVTNDEAKAALAHIIDERRRVGIEIAAIEAEEAEIEQQIRRARSRTASKAKRVGNRKARGTSSNLH